MFNKLVWYVNRLKAMNFLEVCWRISQIYLQKQEQKKYGKNSVSVASEVFDNNLVNLKFDFHCLRVNFRNQYYRQNTVVNQLKGPDYERWPMTFCYDLDYRLRDDLGDARTNWEKNRHFEWALLAKAYYVNREEKYLRELTEKIEAWCKENPFLHGICWTSAMELAIRAINWMYSLAFLQAAGVDNVKLQIGTINMVDYLTKHYSHFSSANNHLLVEAAAIGLAGYAFHHQPWKNMAVRILSEELDKQNYSDGVNKEQSLHYQTFGMEAYLLLAHVSGECRWNEMLRKQSEYVSHATWREKTVCEFGDDDEGKILDLQGGHWHQWEWVLQLGSLVTGIRYSRFEDICENTRWLFTDEEIEAIKKKPLYDHTKSRCFDIGGNSFLRDKEDRILIGIDHAALGFGTIAAHGHADALSFQVLVDGEPVITDPGTYIYHCDLENRNAFRKTINHSTVCIGGRDQSEMLGAFLWGKRAECKLEYFSSNEDWDVLAASHDGYKPVIHQRTFEWNKDSRRLRVKDTLTQETDWVSTLMLGKNIGVVSESGEKVELQSGRNNIIVSVNTKTDKLVVENAEVSTEYGVKFPSKAIRIYGHTDVCIIAIEINYS